METTLTDLLLLEEQRIATLLSGGGARPRERFRAETVEILDAAIAQLGAGGAAPSDATAAQILVGVADVVTRDLASVVEPAQAPAALALWDDLGRRAPQGWAAPPWCIRALLHWQRGDRRAALTDAHLAVADDPSYRMAHYVLQACQHALDATHVYRSDGSVRQRRERLRQVLPAQRAKARRR
jgi:hypothetical protein